MLANRTHPTTDSSSAPSTVTELLSAAKEYLARGWSVIPLSGKLPTRPWKEFQTRLPTSAELATWFRVEPAPTGLGIVTGKFSGLVVVDCDTRNDAAIWEGEQGSSPLVVSTGGGGVHFYYALAAGDDVRNRVKILGRQIDIRGEGGYVAAPPSLHPSDARYAWRACDWRATLPTFNSAWLTPEDREPQFPTTPTTTNVRKALAYILRIEAVAGEMGHNATFRAACKLRDAGLSEQEALSLLTAWNATNATPPWSDRELQHKIRSAYGARSSKR